MFLRSNIIKRTFCHHRDLIKIPTSPFFDKEKIEETNKNIQMLDSKINHIQVKIDQENNNIKNYIVFNFILTNAIGLPIIIIGLTHF